jgi:hypothetical protein
MRVKDIQWQLSHPSKTITILPQLLELRSLDTCAKAKQQSPVKVVDGLENKTLQRTLQRRCMVL